MEEEMTEQEKTTYHPVRIRLDADLYEQLKKSCVEHGDISRLVRYLLREWLKLPHERDALVNIQKEAHIKPGRPNSGGSNES